MIEIFFKKKEILKDTYWLSLGNQKTHSMIIDELSIVI